jgi:sugar phosphate isomerase/epimerase
MSIPIGLQLYAVRAECAKDFPGTLSALAEMGYAGVEFAGYYGRTATLLRRMLDERGLKCGGTHTRLDLLLGDEFERTLEFNLALGSPYVVVPSLPEANRQSRATWLDSARVLNELAARMRPRGLRLGYHNHRYEFEAVDGALPWDLIFGAADPSLVMQLDMGHALEAGSDPLAVLQRYPGRAATVHLAEHSASDPLALLGEGDVPWRAVLAACSGVGGTQWYIVEQERYRYPQLECARRCLVNLREYLM